MVHSFTVSTAARHALAREPFGLATVASTTTTEGVTMTTTTTTTTTTTPAERMDAARAALAFLSAARTHAADVSPGESDVMTAALALADIRDHDGMTLADIGKVLPLQALAPKADGTPDTGTVSRLVLAGQAARLWADDGITWADAKRLAGTTGAGAVLRDSVTAAHAVIALGLTAPDGASVRAACERAADAANAERRRKAAERASKRADAKTPQGRATVALAALASVSDGDWSALADAVTGNAPLLAVIATARTLSARVPMTADGSAVMLAVVASDESDESDAA